MSEKDLDTYSSPQSISDGSLDAATAEMVSVGGDSPFPEGNPDSPSPSSNATAVGATKPPPGPASNQEEVFIIDELQPAERLDDEETEHHEGRGEAASPSRTTSMTEDEALGISTEVHPPEDKSLEEAFEVVDIVEEYTDTTKKQMSNTAGSSLKEVKRDGKGKEREGKEEVVKEKGKEWESRKIKEKEEKNGNNGEHSEKSTKERGKNRDISPITFDKDGKSVKGGKGKEKQEPPLSGPHKINDRLFSNTRYFVMKSNNFENIEIAKDKSVWSTPPYNEKKLNKAYRDCRNVILIFSVRESGRFQGYARLVSESRHDGPHVPWILPPGISQAQLGGVFRLEWIHKGSLDFNGCQELKNPWNDNKPVKISRDGQEVEPTVGERLCRLWMKIDSEEDFSSSMPPVRHSSQAHPYNRHSHMSPYAPAYPPYPHHHHPVAGYGPMGPMMSDARGGRLLMQPSVVFPPPSKQYMSEAAALLDLRKKRKVEERLSPPLAKKSLMTYTASGDSSRYYSDPQRSSHRGGKERREERSHRERGRERRRSRSRSRERERERKQGRYNRKDEKKIRRRSPISPSFEDDFGVSKETLLHGSYADYIKEYSARSSRAGGSQSQVPPPQHSSHPHNQSSSVLASLAAAYQKTLSEFTSTLAQQGPPKMDPKTYSRRVEEFLSKTRGNKSGH